MKTNKSIAWYKIAQQYIPGGVNSPVRSFKAVGMSPLFIKSANGSKITDVDDNEYIDYINSWGPLILGHNQIIDSATITKLIQQGTTYGLATPIEAEIAQLIVEAYQCIDQVRMVNSGTEATMSAIRLARAYTKRDKIIKFAGNYHGHNDSLLASAGSGLMTHSIAGSAGVTANNIKDTIVVEYNDIAQLEQAFKNNENEIAAVIIEPVAANMGLIAPLNNYLKKIRELCDRRNTLLIFDEVITGFRLAYGGASDFYKIIPDLVCFGKIIGGGLPVGAYGGKSKIMQLIAPVGNVYQAGTLSGNPLAMHLGYATIKHLKQNPEIYQALTDKAIFLEKSIIKLAKQYRQDIQVNRVGSLLSLFFSKQPVTNYKSAKLCDNNKFITFFKTLLNNNILIGPSQYEIFFLSTAHTKQDLDETIKVIEKAFQALGE